MNTHVLIGIALLIVAVCALLIRSWRKDQQEMKTMREQLEKTKKEYGHLNENADD